MGQADLEIVQIQPICRGSHKASWVDRGTRSDYFSFFKGMMKREPLGQNHQLET